MTALQPAGGHLVDASEWPFAAPTLVVPAIQALDSDFAATFHPGPETGEPGPQSTPDQADSESELGDILVRVQQFAGETEEQARREAQIIVDSARTEARLIIAGAEQSAPTVIESARIEARRIIEETSGQASQQAGEIIDSARLEARRIIEQAREEALRHVPEITESARTDAQRTVEQAKQQATQHARGIVESARAEAQRIVDEATRNTLDRGSVAQPSVASATVAELSASIREFAESNSALVDELTRLRDTLAPTVVEAPSAGPESPSSFPKRSPDSQLLGDLHAFGRPRA
jgi:vacuolar-type H+-ATPase subunit H